MSVKGLNRELARLYDNAAADTKYPFYAEWCRSQADLFRRLDAGKGIVRRDEVCAVPVESTPEGTHSEPARAAAQNDVNRRGIHDRSEGA